MQYGVEPIQIGRGEIAQVFDDLGHRRGRRSEFATREQVGVEADYLMAGGLQNRSCDRANISFVTRQKNSHVTPI